MFTNKHLVMLDGRHRHLDSRWKSSADPYYGKTYRLNEDIEEWLKDQNLEYWYGEAPFSKVSAIYFDSLKDAMLFKLTWI